MKDIKAMTLMLTNEPIVFTVLKAISSEVCEGAVATADDDRSLTGISNPVAGITTLALQKRAMEE